MLQYSLEKNNGGFTLWGNYSSLKPLHTFLCTLSEQNPVLNDEGLAMALAYDIRKAYEGQRKSEKQEVWGDEITTYGVEMVWPTFIAQVALLRTGMAFKTSSKLDQAQMYTLEGLLESALRSAFPDQADVILHHYERLIGKNEERIASVLGSRVSYFILSLEKNERRDKLASLISSLFEVYGVLYDPTSLDSELPFIDPKEFKGRSWDDLNNMTVKL